MGSWIFPFYLLMLQYMMIQPSGLQSEKIMLMRTENILEIQSPLLYGGFEKFILLVHQCFDIFFRCGNRCNTIIFNQKVQNIRRKERRKRRTKTDIFDTQMQEG